MRRALLAVLALGAVGAGALYVAMPDLPEMTPEQASRLRHESYTAPTGRVATLRAGLPDGPRLIYVHGTPGDATNWLPMLLDPLPGFTSIAIDRPGFGDSEPQGAVPSLAQQAEAIVPLLEPRDGMAPLLVGHSLGGPIIAELAARHPDRVGGLLIVAGSLDPDLEEWHWYNRAGSVLEPLLSRPLRNSNLELAPLRDELVALRGRLGAIRCPVVLLHGTEDGLVPYANTDYMRARMTGADPLRLIRLEGADHFLIWNRQEDLRAAIRALAELVRAR